MAFGIAEVLSVGMKIIDKFIPDPAQKAAAIQKLKEMDHAELMAGLDFDKAVVEGQLAINAEEAKSTNIFVAGWRPAVGWVGAAALAYHFILQPLLTWALYVAGNQFPLPAFDLGELMTIVLGLLGLGGARTFEKIKGVAK